jgi:hypothetical protein
LLRCGAGRFHHPTIGTTGGYKPNYSISRFRFPGPGNTGYKTGEHSFHPLKNWHGLVLPYFDNSNTSTGYQAMLELGTGTGNVADGYRALFSALSSTHCVAVGANAMLSSENEQSSVAIGYLAMSISSSSAGNNTAIGTTALEGFPGGNTGSWNAVIGSEGMLYNNTGSYNAASGALSMLSNTTGSYNTANGAGTLYNNTTGSSNVGIGELAMINNTTGSDNTGLGTFATTSSGSLTNAMALGANSVVSASNSVVVGTSAVTSIGGYTNWSNFSDGRYKKNIQQNVPGLAFINKLNPITYTLDIDGIEAKLHEKASSVVDKNLGTPASYLNDPVMKTAMQEKASIFYTGFIAQDVEKTADSIGYIFSGIDKPKDINQSFYGLRYGDFVVPLVKAVQELSASSIKKDSIINSMQGKFDSLQTQLNELRAILLAKNLSAMSGATLDQNAPNPFAGSTTIGYNLPKGAASAKMQITDVSGKVLAIIPLSGNGRNTVTASVSGYASGIYNYSLIINGQLIGTKQMISIR